ncbi:MAG: hypothetical protein IPH31_07320 [Lewinellaceae bacterium]|nr:hypothetical protein [Lewinellaceae bacterium]
MSDALIRRVINHREYFKYFTNWIALQYENTKTTVMDGEAVYVHIIKNYFTDELAFWDKPENLKGLRKHVWKWKPAFWAERSGCKARDINGALKKHL